MKNIIIINGPNINLLGEREQSQYGSITYDDLKNKCIKYSKDLGVNIEFTQSNIEGEIVTIIQNAKEKLFKKGKRTKYKFRFYSIKRRRRNCYSNSRSQK